MKVIAKSLLILAILGCGCDSDDTRSELTRSKQGSNETIAGVKQENQPKREQTFARKRINSLKAEQKQKSTSVEELEILGVNKYLFYSSGSRWISALNGKVSVVVRHEAGESQVSCCLELQADKKVAAKDFVDYQNILQLIFTESFSTTHSERFIKWFQENAAKIAKPPFNSSQLELGSIQAKLLKVDNEIRTMISFPKPQR